MFQQWARQYVTFTQLPRRGPRKWAQIRALFAGSVDKLFIKTMGILLPCYLHLAILLFFIGLIIFLHNVNNTIFINITWFFGFCMTIYSFFTILPLFQSDSLLYTLVSALPATFVVLLTCLIHSTFADRFKFKTWSVFEWLFEDIGNKVEVISLDSSERTPEVDARILESTLNSLSEDDAMEKFFEAIPDFFGSKSVNLRPTDLSKKLRGTFEETLYEFLDYTFQSTAVSDFVKNSRLIICLKASRAALGPNGSSWIICKILDRNWPKLLQSVEIGHSLKSWVNSNDEDNVLYIQSLSHHIVANAEKRDDRWLALAADQPGLSEDLLRHYPAHGDSVLLSNLINITRLTFRAHLPNWEFFHAIPSKGGVSSTLPTLQHDFCALWNEIVLEVQSSQAPLPSFSSKTSTLFTLRYTQGPMLPCWRSPLITIFRISRRHINYAISRVIVQIRRPMITMRRLEMFLLLSTRAFSLSRIIMRRWSPGLIHLICPCPNPIPPLFRHLSLLVSTARLFPLRH